jgi:hypothetical protein
MSIEDEVNEAAGLPDIPELPGWKSLPAVGNKLHVSRQRIFQMALIERRFKTLHLIPGGVGPNGEERRPMGYVVAVEEMNEFLAAQKAAMAGDASECPACAGVTGVVNVPADRFCREHGTASLRQPVAS